MIYIIMIDSLALSPAVPPHTYIPIYKAFCLSSPPSLPIAVSQEYTLCMHDHLCFCKHLRVIYARLLPQDQRQDLAALTC